MKIIKFLTDPWNRQNAVWRIAVLGVVVIAWAIWGVVIFQEGREIQARIQREQQEELTRQAILRRKAALDQQEREQRFQNDTQNIMDTLPGGQI